MTTQDEQRQRNRKLRVELSERLQQDAANALCANIIALDEYQHADEIATYFAVNGEISLRPLIDHALSLGKHIYLPNLDTNTLRFSPYFHDQKMRINYFRLPEPDVGDEEMLSPEELDLVLAPLVAFDLNRNRVGMGGGFYDRSFAFRKDPKRRKPALMGVAHELQKVEHIAIAQWDVQLDLVVTDAAIYR